jgi:hypothetical protein
MSTDNKIKRLNELNQLEEELKVKRDFKGLIDIYDESMELLESIGNHTERIPQKAYCLARLGHHEEAKKTIELLSTVSFFSDQDELFRAITLVSFFMSTPASELNLMQLNTIKYWLSDPKASKQVVQIVFDYSDFVGMIKPFDNSRFLTKQTYFSDELLECVFAAMGRDDDTKIYYNRELNDVQQEVEGYLVSHMASDQTGENSRLADRIMNYDSTDPIIDGLHFLIPRLRLITFLEKFIGFAGDNYDLIEFVDLFESAIMEDFGDYVDTIEDLVFSEIVSESFFKELDLWYRNNDFDLDKLRDIVNRTRNSISSEFLLEANEE